MKRALILIDIQNDYFPSGKMELVGSVEASLNAAKVLERARRNDNLIIHVQHVASNPNATFFLPETYGVEIHENVQPIAGEKVIAKHFPNSFHETELLSYLQENDVLHLVVVGMMTHMCVDATTRAAKDLGYAIDLVGDACATRDLEWNGNFVSAKEVQTAFLSALNYFYSSVVSTETYLAGQ